LKQAQPGRRHAQVPDQPNLVSRSRRIPPKWRFALPEHRRSELDTLTSAQITAEHWARMSFCDGSLSTRDSAQLRRGDASWHDQTTQRRDGPRAHRRQIAERRRCCARGSLLQAQPPKVEVGPFGAGVYRPNELPTAGGQDRRIIADADEAMFAQPRAAELAAH
jgi:hypothetical protein